MASIQASRGANGKNRYRVQFSACGKRHTMRLGQTDRRTAESVARHIDALVTSHKTGVFVNEQTERWVEADAADEVVERLAAIGLCKPRQRATLGAFIDAYIAERGDAAENTVRNWRNSRLKLTAYFGDSRDVRRITAGEADQWRQSMVNADFSEATIAKAVKHARHFFRVAKRRGLVPENPFEDVATGSMRNVEGVVFVDRPTIDKVLDATADVEWQLLIGLARFGGVRVPSEALALTWADIDWADERMKVTSPKTKRQGKPYRVVPLFPELRPLLEAAFWAAPGGAVHVIRRYRDRNANLRTQFMRILKRAGVQPWERLFQNLRASRETELADRFPIQVVTDWLGNTPTIAAAHYLSTTEEHFQAALKPPPNDAAGEAMQKATTQLSAARSETQQGSGDDPGNLAFCGVSPDAAGTCRAVKHPLGESNNRTIPRAKRHFPVGAAQNAAQSMHVCSRFSTAGPP